jgi:hypothetical protein
MHVNKKQRVKGKYSIRRKETQLHYSSHAPDLGGPEVGNTTRLKEGFMGNKFRVTRPESS